MRLRNKTSYINKSVEGVAPTKSAVIVTHKTYLLILILVLSYFIYSVYQSFTTYEGAGHVRVNKTLLSSSYDGEIIQLTINEGESVVKGDLLVRLKSATACQAKELKKEKTIVQLAYELEIKQLKMNSLSNQIASLTGSEHQQMLKRALELNGRSFRDRRDILNLQNDLDFLAQKFAAKKKLMEYQRNHGSYNDCPDEYIHAPFDGIIKRVFLKLNEFSSRGEGLILVQPKNASVRIEAFVNKKEMQNLRVKQDVEVIFPDNVRSIGVIEAFHSSAYAFPDLEWNDYEPVDARVLVHINPKDNEALSLWKKYDLLRVRIQGNNG